MSINYRARALDAEVRPGFNAVVDDPSGWPICHCPTIEQAQEIAAALNKSAGAGMVPDPRLVALADRLQALIGFGRGEVPQDEELERAVLWHVNSVVNGDSGYTFLHGHRPALHFIAQLLHHNCFVGSNVPSLRDAALPFPPENASG